MKNKLYFKSIRSRFFVMNLTLFIILVCTQLFAQGFLFERFYIKNKSYIVKNEIKKFEQFIGQLKGGYENNLQEVMNYMLMVSEDKKIDLSIRTQNLSKVVEIEYYMKKNYLTLKDQLSHEKYKVVVGDFLSGIELASFDRYKIEGRSDPYGYIIPKRIWINHEQVAMDGMDVALITPFNVKDSRKYIKLQQSIPITINGVVNVPTLEKDDLIVLKSVIANMPYTVKEMILKHSNGTHVEKFMQDNNEYLITSKKIGENYIVAINQLTEVADVIQGMDYFYIVVFFLALPIIAFVSLVYSEFMAKPLIEMSEVAKEIANANFETQYSVKSKDEIATLGNALNDIASNLEESLSALQEKIELQNRQEEKRKELIDNISHELKTPLTIIQGNVEAFKNGIYTDKVLDDILEETVKMNALLMEMLEVSNLEEPTFALNYELFDFNTTLLKEIDTLRLIFNENDLKLKIAIEEELQGEELVVIGDEYRIQEVLRNLLTNAIKYTPKGEVVVVSVKAHANNYCCVIENFGVTLKTEEIDTIWEPFCRVEKSRNKKYGGNGLGLCIVKRILELHKSTYGVEVGENSIRFYFTLAQHVL